LAPLRVMAVNHISEHVESFRAVLPIEALIGPDP
jgi:hypothetical protein